MRLILNLWNTLVHPKENEFALQKAVDESSEMKVTTITCITGFASFLFVLTLLYIGFQNLTTVTLVTILLTFSLKLGMMEIKLRRIKKEYLWRSKETFPEFIELYTKLYYTYERMISYTGHVDMHQAFEEAEKYNVPFSVIFKDLNLPNLNILLDYFGTNYRCYLDEKDTVNQEHCEYQIISLTDGLSKKLKSNVKDYINAIQPKRKELSTYAQALTEIN